MAGGDGVGELLVRQDGLERPRERERRSGGWAGRRIHGGNPCGRRLGVRVQLSSRKGATLRDSKSANEFRLPEVPFHPGLKERGRWRRTPHSGSAGSAGSSLFASRARRCARSAPPPVPADEIPLTRPPPAPQGCTLGDGEARTVGPGVPNLTAAAGGIESSQHLRMSAAVSPTCRPADQGELPSKALPAIHPDVSRSLNFR